MNSDTCCPVTGLTATELTHIAQTVQIQFILRKVVFSETNLTIPRLAITNQYSLPFLEDHGPKSDTMCAS